MIFCSEFKMFSSFSFPLFSSSSLFLVFNNNLECSFIEDYLLIQYKGEGIFRWHEVEDNLALGRGMIEDYLLIQYKGERISK